MKTRYLVVAAALALAACNQTSDDQDLVDDCLQDMLTTADQITRDNPGAERAAAMVAAQAIVQGRRAECDELFTETPGS